jgi:hypothetical protein
MFIIFSKYFKFFFLSPLPQTVISPFMNENFNHSTEFCSFLHNLNEVFVSEMSVCLPACAHITRKPLNRFSVNLVFESLLKCFRKFQFWLKSDDSNGHFAGRDGCRRLWAHFQRGPVRCLLERRMFRTFFESLEIFEVITQKLFDVVLEFVGPILIRFSLGDSCLCALPVLRCL